MKENYNFKELKRVLKDNNLEKYVSFKAKNKMWCIESVGDNRFSIYYYLNNKKTRRFLSGTKDMTSVNLLKILAVNIDHYYYMINEYSALVFNEEFDNNIDTYKMIICAIEEYYDITYKDFLQMDYYKREELVKSISDNIYIRKNK